MMIFNIIQSIRILSDSCNNFAEFLVEGTKPNTRQLNYFLERSLMLVTALSPVIGYDKASKVAHYAHKHDLTLKEACLQLGYISEEQFEQVVDARKMIYPNL
jgi:fumarate hydratase class II